MAIFELARTRGMNAVIPPKKNRIAHWAYDEDLYKLRHMIENAFLHLKRWRGIATHYVNNCTFILADTTLIPLLSG